MEFRIALQTLIFGLSAVVMSGSAAAHGVPYDWEETRSAASGQITNDRGEHASGMDRNSSDPLRVPVPLPVQNNTGDAMRPTVPDPDPEAQMQADRFDAEKLPSIEPLFVRAFTVIVAGHNDSNPIWSPTGNLIAFERSLADKREIIIARFDGAVLQRIYHRLSAEDAEMDSVFADIFNDVSYNAGISWAPNENQLVFMSNGGSGNYDLYLLAAIGGMKTIRLTEHEEMDGHPHWNPVADRLVFVSGRTGKADIYVMDLVSRNVIKLTNGHKTYLYPQWSPDGTKIVVTHGSNENHDIFLIEDFNRPTETLRALTRWDFDDLRPVWSPDGKRIAFYSNFNPENDAKNWSIIVIDADGSSPIAGEDLAEKVVAHSVIPDIERGPAWMPDSKRIVYVKDDRQTYNPIYIVDIEERKNFRINTQTKMNHDIACSPDGTLAFRAQVEQWDHIYIAKLKE